MTGLGSWRTLALLAIISIHSACCFLFKRDEDSGDKVAHLRSRYWNDDIQPCIERYCLPYVNKQRVYVKCLQHYCPAGLLTLPQREVDDLVLPISQILADTDFCQASHTSYMPPECKADRCDNILEGADPDADPADIFKYGVYNLCRAILCADMSDARAQKECVAERCCGQSAEEPTRKRAMSALRRPDTFLSARKRRINDEVAQCMQSYCSGLNGKIRRDCIVRNCHRLF